MIIHIENYSFDSAFFHSVGVVRIDPRGKGQVLKDIQEKIVPDKDKWPLRLQLYLLLPAEGVKVLNLESFSGEHGTITMYLTLHEQLQKAGNWARPDMPPIETGEWKPTRKLLDFMLKVNPGPAREGGTEEK